MTELPTFYPAEVLEVCPVNPKINRANAEKVRLLEALISVTERLVAQLGKR